MEAAPGDDHEPYLLVKAKLRPESEPAGSGKNAIPACACSGQSVDEVGADKLIVWPRNHLTDRPQQFEVLGSLSWRTDGAGFLRGHTAVEFSGFDRWHLDRCSLFAGERKAAQGWHSSYSVALCRSARRGAAWRGVLHKYYDVRVNTKKRSYLLLRSMWRDAHKGEADCFSNPMQQTISHSHQFQGQAKSAEEGLASMVPISSISYLTYTRNLWLREEKV